MSTEKLPLPLWQPTQEQIQNSNMYQFMSSVAQKHRRPLNDYSELYQWSITDPEAFWSDIWSYTEIRASKKWDVVLTDPEAFPGATWFSAARLNFAENLLRNRTNKTALISRLENGQRTVMTYAELHNQVAQCAAAMRAMGVTVGDRVAGFMPNVSQTIIAMLATASIGAIWSSCSPDFGINGVMDRFGQIKPKLLFGCTGYYYNGKTIDSMPQLQEICDKIKSIQKLVLVPIIEFKSDIANHKTILFNDFLITKETPELAFEQLPFDHPLYIMYSSGTTGMPKCIVHGAGGTLIQHLKEHRLHVNLKPSDVIFFYTTCGWMMWNWLVSALASEATVVLFDGSPFYPQPQSLFDMAEQEKISVFGTSAKYIAALEKADVKPSKSHDLTSLNTLLSTGSPLSHESFRYVYKDIKTDICLASISGGTDIVSCFVLGNPTIPVWEGEIQCRGLGMAVDVWDDQGLSIIAEKGELVCTKPFPNAPICFWNDDANKKYLDAYFETYQGVWAQGDYGEITEHGGMIIHGRSDAVLNPGGVRIGTAEIYRQVEKIDKILDSICIGQTWQDDVRVILFVVLKSGTSLTQDLEQQIRATIREETTPRHVPAKIIAVADIPRTISGKIVELAVRKVVHNEIVTNTDALANPEALDYFKNLFELKT
jgi:acetoacetyl-CoA synthetase